VFFTTFFGFRREKMDDLNKLRTALDKNIDRVIEKFFEAEEERRKEEEKTRLA
jgi:hypothetical protein